MTAAVSLDAVAKRWGDTVAVQDITLTAEAGRFLTLLGPSGCGKSTTMRLIAGLEEVSGGTITIGGRDVTRLPPAKRGVAMVFQSYALFPHLTVRENLLFGLKIRRVAVAERDRRLVRVAGLLSIDRLLDRKPAQLSGGQQQRVALGRALISETGICLMDEPLSNLDAQLRNDMRREIRALQESLGMTMIYVTHDQTEAMSMSDRVVLMNHGGIEQMGTPAEIYARPASLFAARFIGAAPMDLVPLAAGRIVGGGDGPAVASAAAAGSLILGLRPEDVRLGEGAEGQPAAVAACDYLGADTLVSCRVGGGDHRLTARLPGHHRLMPGTPVRLVWSAAAQHLFDAESGRRRVEFDAPAAAARAVPA